MDVVKTNTLLRSRDAANLPAGPFGIQVASRCSFEADIRISLLDRIVKDFQAMSRAQEVSFGFYNIKYFCTAHR